MKKYILALGITSALAGLLGTAIYFQILPDTNVKSIGYQYAIREDVSNLPPISTTAGYTSLNAQSFFSGRVKIRKLALSIVEGETTELGKAQALIDWVQLHVRPQTSAPTTVITDDYVNIIKRGWGYCDQMAHVFATMATYVGLEAVQLQLFKDDGVSPHTLAMVKIDRKFRIAEPWRGVIPKNFKGEPYTKTGFIHRLEKGDVYELAPIGATEFKNSKSLKTFPYTSNVQIINKILRRLGERLRNLTFSPSSSPSSISSEVVASTQIPQGDLEMYDSARNSHLDMDYELALKIYAQIIGSTKSKVLKDEAQFASGMAAYDGKLYSIALQTFDKIIRSREISPWKLSAERIKAEILLRNGNLKEALLILDAIGTVQSKVRAYEIRSIKGLAPTDSVVRIVP